jgi:hypothetical protein
VGVGSDAPDVRRYNTPLTINIAAGGGQQVNVQKKIVSKEKKPKGRTLKQSGNCKTKSTV